MRFFFDCMMLESGAGSPLDLISIGMIRESDSAEYYAADVTVGHLVDCATVKDRASIAADLLEFMSVGEHVELWACCGAYDYVALRQLFGSVDEAPPGFPSFHYELMQEIVFNECGFDDLPRLEGAPPTALGRARWARDVAAYLDGLPVIGGGKP